MTDAINNPVETIRLKNGSELNRDYVILITTTLKTLYSQNQIVFYGLVLLCKDSEYKPFGTTKDVLKKLLLLGDDGIPLLSVKNIVLSSVEGDNSKLKLVSPFAESP